jgi:hypothetical protein
MTTQSSYRTIVLHAQAAQGMTPDMRPIERMRKAFVRGDSSLDAIVRGLYD